MGAQRFREVNTSSRELQQIQSNVDQALNALGNTDIIKGRLIENVQIISATGTAVPHKLGRKLKGWFTTRVRGNVRVYDEQDSNVSPELTVVLRSSNDVIVDVWVF